MVTLNKEQLRIWQDQDLEHKRYEYDVKPGELCLDIGSYHREWGNEMIKRYGCIVESFDALDNRAAWLHDGQIEVGGAYYYTSSLLPATGTVSCVDISKYLQQEIAVCKINIEGGEYHLVLYMLPWLKNIRNLQVQFHLVEGLDCEKIYSRLAEEISKTHTLEWRYPFVWESWKRNV